MKLPSHIHLDKLNIPYEARSFSPETEKGAANVAHTLGFSERQAVKTSFFKWTQASACLSCSVVTKTQSREI